MTTTVEIPEAVKEQVKNRLEQWIIVLEATKLFAQDLKETICAEEVNQQEALDKNAQVLPKATNVTTVTMNEAPYIYQELQQALA